MSETIDPDWGWWRERRVRPERVHLDSVAAAQAAPVLAQGRAELAGLLGVPPAGLAFVPSAEAGLRALLACWPFGDGDTVAVVPCEWGPNLHAFGHRGLRVTELAASADGAVDLTALERMLAQTPARRPALVHLTQVTSHRALVQPVAAAAALCRAAEVPLWVDAAQALGHVDTACGADAIYATSRKWLTGPRGVDLAGVAERWWDRLRVSAPDLVASQRPEPLLRVSPHVDCTAADLDRLRQALLALG